MASDNTEQKQSGLIPFEAGKSGNPTGRPKGSRNKLGEAFIQALHDDFQDNGAATIAKVREEDPTAYVKVCASLLPKELKIERVDELNDEQLDQRIRQLASLIGVEIGASEPAGGQAAESQPEQAGDVSALH